MLKLRSRLTLKTGALYGRCKPFICLHVEFARISIRVRFIVRLVWCPIVLLKCPPDMVTLREAWKKVEVEGSGATKGLNKIKYDNLDSTFKTYNLLTPGALVCSGGESMLHGLHCEPKRLYSYLKHHL